MEDWRIRLCGDTATAITLARGHDHVALVAQSTALVELRAKRLRRISLTGMPRWIVHLDLVHRTSDRADEVIRAVRDALPEAG